MRLFNTSDARTPPTRDTGFHGPDLLVTEDLKN